MIGKGLKLDAATIGLWHMDSAYDAPLIDSAGVFAPIPGIAYNPSPAGYFVGGVPEGLWFTGTVGFYSVDPIPEWLRLLLTTGAWTVEWVGTSGSVSDARPMSIGPEVVITTSELEADNLLFYVRTASRQASVIWEAAAGADKSYYSGVLAEWVPYKFQAYAVTIAPLAGTQRRVRWYFNGQLVSETLIATAPAGGQNARLHIGRDPSYTTTAGGWNGILADLRLSNVERTAEEIAESHQRTVLAYYAQVAGTQLAVDLVTQEHVTAEPGRFLKATALDAAITQTKVAGTVRQSTVKGAIEQ